MRFDLCQGLVDIGIHHNVVVFIPVLYLSCRTRHAMRHRGLGILIARLEPPLERLAVRRQNEHAHHVSRQAFLELPRALPVDVEQHVVARLQGIEHRRPRRGIKVAEHFRPFEQLATAL